MSEPTNPWDVGYCVNPVPPEPPMGTELAMAHRPNECDWYRSPYGWRMPAWDRTGVVDPDVGETWTCVRTTFGPLVVVGHRDTEMPDGTVVKAWHDPAKAWPIAPGSLVEFPRRQLDTTWRPRDEAHPWVETWHLGEVVGQEWRSGERLDETTLVIVPRDGGDDVRMTVTEVRRPA